MTCKDKAAYASLPPCTLVMCLSVKDFIHVAWLNHVWYDSIVYIYVVCSNLEIASRPAITSYVRHDSFIYVTHHMLDTTHLYAWHDSSIRALWPQNRPAPRKQILCVTWLIHICDTTHLYEWHDSFIRCTLILRWLCAPQSRPMGWLRLVGALKL